MGRETVASSNIESVGYDPRTQTVEVAFLMAGAVYQILWDTCRLT
ncbi:KTSC domain-containing protein [Candidatus Palauibacter sp.]